MRKTMPDRILAALGCRRRKSTRNAGSAAVEFAITVPLLVAVALGAADYGTMAVQQAALEGATRAGAEYARTNCTTIPLTSARTTGTQSRVTGFTTFSPALNAFDCASEHSCVLAVCTCADGTSVSCPGPGAPTNPCAAKADPRLLEYVSVTATQTFSPLFSYASFAFPPSLSATTVARIQ
jgi:Flp pilus assembly protein TadG